MLIESGKLRIESYCCNENRCQNEQTIRHSRKEFKAGSELVSGSDNQKIPKLRDDAVRRVQHDGSKGFTLAEILIALTIIGVISAVTVPVLMQNTNQQEYVTALKKTYSALSQVTNQIIADEGSPKGDDSWLTDADSLYNMYKKYLNNAKECAGGSGCFPSGGYKFLNGGSNATHVWNNSAKYRKLISADGVLLLFRDVNNECSTEFFGNNSICARIIADLNGMKNPNKYGRDAFEFVLKENGLYPSGCDADTLSGNCTNSDLGHDCACRVLKENAMNY